MTLASPIAAIIAALCLSASIASAQPSSGQPADSVEACVKLLSSNLKGVASSPRVDSFLQTVQQELPGVAFSEYHKIKDERLQLLKVACPKKECRDLLAQVDQRKDEFRKDSSNCEDLIEANEQKFTELLEADPVMTQLLPKIVACFSFSPNLEWLS
jgi:hypothetical protein